MVGNGMRNVFAVEPSNGLDARENEFSPTQLSK